MPALYELGTELARINDELITADGDLSPDLEKRLDEVNLAITEKAHGIRKWIAIVEGDDGALDAEIKRLQKIKRTNDNLYERLKEYVKKNMEVADKKKIETPIGSFTIAANPSSVECIAEEMTPEQFRIPVPATWTPDKKLIKAATEEGYDVPGWKLVNNKTHLRVK